MRQHFSQANSYLGKADVKLVEENVELKRRLRRMSTDNKRLQMMITFKNEPTSQQDEASPVVEDKDQDSE